MADARRLLNSCSGSARVRALSHLEFRVWIQYLLSADDFGVVQASASFFRGENENLDREPLKRIEQALGKIVDVGLVRVFNDNGRTYLWQTDWQTYQLIRYPRNASRPAPPSDELAHADEPTRHLFTFHGKTGRRSRGTGDAISPDGSGNGSAPVPQPTRAGGRQTLTLTQTPTLTQTQTQTERDTNSEPPLPALSTVPPRWKKPALHAMHAFCGRVCVPFGLHADFMARLGRDDSAARLMVWYAATLARYDGREIGDDLFAFWRNEFTAWVGTVTSALDAKPGKGQQTIDAVGRGVQRFLAKQERIGGGS